MPVPAQATMQMENPLLARSTSAQRFDPQRLFVSQYKLIRRALEAHRAQGLLTIAFGPDGEAVGQAWLAASLDKTRAMIIGRHSMCDLALPDQHTQVSLRHLVVMSRAISHSESAVRVVDLHTQSAFSDEAGRLLTAVSAEGSIFLKIGPITLMMLATEDNAVLADEGAAQYATIPERVFLDERVGVAGDIPKREAIGALGLTPSMTHVRSHVGPLAAAGQLCGEDERPLGTLVVRGANGAGRRPVGASILERGLLVGRYGRCDVGVSFVETSRLSRVHLLVLRDGDDVIAIDTGSVNGTKLGDKEVRLHRWADGDSLDLGGELELTWHREA